MATLLQSIVGYPTEQEVILLSCSTDSDVYISYRDRRFINDLLPPELLCEIFILAHASHPLTSIFRNPLHHLAQPLILRNVCKRWKFLAESTRLLWTQFEISLMTGPSLTCSSNLVPYRCLEKAREMMKRWLKFACSNLDLDPDVTYRYPGLRFTFETGGLGLSHGTPIERVILKVLTDFSPHWQHVTIRIPIIHMARYLDLSPVRGRINRLESLTLDGNDTYSTSDAIPNKLLDLFEIAPRLARLSLDGFYDVALRMPFEQLKRVSIKDMNTLDSYHLLRGSANSVETASVSPLWTHMGRSSTLPLVVLPRLTALQYINNGDTMQAINWAKEIFRHLETPNLHTLILHDCFHRSSYREAFKMVLRSQSKCSIKHIELRGIGGNEPSDIFSLLDFTTSSVEYLLVEGILGVVASRPSRMYQQYVQELVTTTEVITHLAAKIQSHRDGFVKLNGLVLKLTIHGGEVFIGISCLRALYEAVLTRNKTKKDGNPVKLRLRIRISGSSDKFLQDMRRELEDVAGGLNLRGDEVLLEHA
ncbi:hypothetical protein E1B28_013071 [Marasmius oreades]|uniref:F-box domain-containing protein n=1 Tax=Marasmius oreades TaxID=181124 RepID=A0A9P7RNU6_9AGAR|nr:uncharacterized protein E1B28_013071 [Marasmius oreades]KAG7087089.1 hypothetical protein E1B28_013071 [Marasmius oreades]